MSKDQFSMKEFILVLASLTLLACVVPTSYHVVKIEGTTKIYRIEHGQQTLVYEEDKDGKRTIHDSLDPKYKDIIETDRLAQEEIQKVSFAAKRNPSDPIYVKLHSIMLSDNLKGIERAPGAVNAVIRKEFRNDLIIKLIKKNHPNTYADVDILLNAHAEPQMGVNRLTNKLEKSIILILNATITSRHVNKTISINETGYVSNHFQLTSRFTHRIKDLVQKEFGPSIPARRRVY